MNRGPTRTLGWIGAIWALGVSLFLIQSGRTNRRSVPATMASVELVQAILGTDDSRSNASLRSNQPEGSEFAISTTRADCCSPT